MNFLNEAIRQARRSQFKYRLGAVIFSGKNLVSAGFNKAKSHPIIKTWKFGTIHAEIDALLKLPQNLPRNMEILVVRLLSDGSLAMSKPCQMCQQNLIDYGIIRMTWSTTEGLQNGIATTYSK
jgi:deoxycytidylate deaminase